jgi:hypothetical protein
VRESKQKMGAVGDERATYVELIDEIHSEGKSGANNAQSPTLCKFLQLPCYNVLVVVHRFLVSHMHSTLAASTYKTTISQTLSDLFGLSSPRFLSRGFSLALHLFSRSCAHRYSPRTKCACWALVKLQCITFVSGIYIVQGY